MIVNKKDFLLSLDQLIEVKPGTLTGAEVIHNINSWDSLTFINFIALVDEQFGITLPPRQFAECKTVNDLIALLGDRIVA